MNLQREAFLQRVRQAVAAGNRAGTARLHAPRAGVGYQGAGVDPVACFCEQLTAAGGQPHRVADRPAAVAKTLQIVRDKSARRIIISKSPILDAVGLAPQLRSAGFEVIDTDSLSEETARDPLFAAEVGISGADYLIAETGSVVMLTKPSEPRSVSLLPPIHIAILEESQILPDLFDLFEPGSLPAREAMPSGVAIITGPSKTGDIELRLVTGVHGPGEIHVILIAD